MTLQPENIAELKQLSVRFGSKGHQSVTAVKGVDLNIRRGETLALVGESGCGKSTLGRVLALFQPPTSGTVRLGGTPIGSTISSQQRRQLCERVQMIFQDPVAALNPRQTVGAIVGEALELFKRGDRQQRQHQVIALLESVGLGADDLNRYPHQFSGGQRQRIAIARALALRPELIIADEPVSALDISVQSQILNLFVELKQQHQLTYLFISHDMAVVKHMADRVAVMYLGAIVEIGSRDQVFNQPAHPYTAALLASVPDINSRKGKFGRTLPGDPPSPASPPSGCPFHPRCSYASDRCRSQSVSHQLLEEGHTVACHYPLTASQASAAGEC
ncbi:MAG: ABC transporter ATP-binding protein [Porticoccaceae bacterium]